MIFIQLIISEIRFRLIITVINGYECGMTIENFNDIKVGDIIEGFEDQEVEE